jgi:hypothetical protein
MAYKDQWATVLWTAMSYGVAFTQDELLQLFGKHLADKYESPQMPKVFRAEYPFGIVEDANDPLSQGGVPYYDAILKGPWKTVDGRTLKTLGNVAVTSMKWNLRKRDHSKFTSKDRDELRSVLKTASAIVRDEIPGPSPRGATREIGEWQLAFWRKHKVSLKEEFGFIKSDVVYDVTLAPWAFVYDAQRYGRTLAGDVGKPRTPALPPKPVKPAPDEPSSEPIAKKKSPWGWVFGLIGAATLLKRG